MKQSVPLPIIIAVVLVVLGGIGFFAWKQVGSASNDKPVTPTMGNPANPPTSREEGMKMRHGGH